MLGQLTCPPLWRQAVSLGRENYSVCGNYSYRWLGGTAARKWEKRWCGGQASEGSQNLSLRTRSRESRKKISLAMQFPAAFGSSDRCNLTYTCEDILQTSPPAKGLN